MACQPYNNCVCRMMESLITDELERSFENLGLFCSSQHGLRKGRSCYTQLLEVIHDCAEIVERNIQIDIIYLDYRKAFKTVLSESSL